MQRILTLLVLGLSFFAAQPALAEEELSDLERVQHLVNEDKDGVISFIYRVEYPWIRQEHRVSLWNIYKADIKALDAECREVTRKLLDDPKATLGPKLREASRSVFHRGEVNSVLLMSAMFKKYAGKHAIDPSAPPHAGAYRPHVDGAVCNRYGKPLGMVQNMFFYAIGDDGGPVDKFLGEVCGEVKALSLCLRDNLVVSESRKTSRKRLIELSAPDMLQTVGARGQ